MHRLVGFILMAAALVVAAVTAAGFQKNVIPLWAAFLGLALSVLVATIIFMRSN